METAERVAGIIAALKKEYPDALCITGRIMS